MRDGNDRKVVPEAARADADPQHTIGAPRRTSIEMVKRAFPPLVDSVASARRFAADCASHLDPDDRNTIILLVSELATNCIKHTESGFQVDIDVNYRSAQVRVTDDGPGTPILRNPPTTATSGRGLRVVEQLSDDWGVDTGRDGHGKTVWFSMSLT